MMLIIFTSLLTSFSPHYLNIKTMKATLKHLADQYLINKQLIHRDFVNISMFIDISFTALFKYIKD